MPDRLSLHEPVLVNTIGHCAGAIIFGILLYLLLFPRRRSGDSRLLPCLAAALALLWNIGSLVGLASAPQGSRTADIIVALSFSVLSLLPAVLLHLSIGPGHPFLRFAGYVVSTTAIALHIGDVLTGVSRFHEAALLLVTAGFGLLTAVSLGLRGAEGRGRIAGGMVLFLFAISFVHFGSGNSGHAWSGELALHHAGIPLALFVLLQDYRFLMMDAFLRFLVNAMLAGLAVWAAIQCEHQLGLFTLVRQTPFYAGLAFAAACLLLSAFAFARSRLQRFLTRAIFMRHSVDTALAEIRNLAGSAANESACLTGGVELISRFMSAERFELAAALPEPEPGWVQAAIPLRFSRGDTKFLLLGPRRGGRRYFSEDFDVLNTLSATLLEQIERLRNLELQALVSQAELRALQAQINPHFFFNSLNTLYGTIARDNRAARRLVLNLAELFRYLFGSERALIRVEDELKIVRAYLEIEELRLGSKLTTEIDCEPSVLSVEIPVLSIQPLVENAVKHGVAAQPGDGFVRLKLWREGDSVAVEIANSGPFLENSAGGSGSGVGLANVRRRLELCYGPAAGLKVDALAESTCVRFAVPVR